MQSIAFWPLTSQTGNNWADYDPTIISKTIVCVEVQYTEIFQRMYRDNDYTPLSRLTTHYGNQLYKCHYLDCPRRLSGFVSRKHCQRHVKSHDRPFKCPVKGCIFADLGYKSEFERNQHLNKHRQAELLMETRIPTQEEEIYPWLFQLVDRNDFLTLEKIWQHCKSVVTVLIAYQLACRAAKRGCLPIVQLIVDFHPLYSDDYHSLLDKKDRRSPDFRIFTLYSFQFRDTSLGGLVRAAIESTNVELVRWILEQTTNWLDLRHRFIHREGSSTRPNIAETRCTVVPYDQVIAEVTSSSSLHVFKIWTEIVLRPGTTVIQQILHDTIQQRVLTAARKTPINELALLDVWRTLHCQGKLNERFLGRALVNISKHGLSIPLAEGLIRLGAPIDFPHLECGGGSSKGMTALHHAAQQTSRRAAEFMKFLLVQNADPHFGYAGTEPSEAAGALGISKWLNMDWREVIQWAKAERKRRRRRRKEESRRSKSR